MSRRADREGVPRIRYLDWPQPAHCSLAKRDGLGAFRRCGMFDACRAYLRDLRAYRLRHTEQQA
jgi:hypothetical protein